MRALDAAHAMPRDSEGPDELETLLRVLLYLNRSEEAAIILERLSATGDQDAPLEELCRKKGVHAAARDAAATAP